MRFYISDLHFYHENLNTKMDNRGFESVEAMNPQADTMFALMELYEANLSDITCKHEDRVSSYREEGLEPSFAFSWRCIFLMGVHRLFCKLLPAFLYHRLEVYYNVS